MNNLTLDWNLLEKVADFLEKVAGLLLGGLLLPLFVSVCKKRLAINEKLRGVVSAMLRKCQELICEYSINPHENCSTDYRNELLSISEFSTKSSCYVPRKVLVYLKIIVKINNDPNSDALLVAQKTSACCGKVLKLINRRGFWGVMLNYC